MTNEALVRIKHLLKDEDDLTKLVQLRQQIAREKAAIDVKLASTSQIQIELVMLNVKQLLLADQTVSRIKQNIQDMTMAYDVQTSKMAEHTLIRQIVGALLNMRRTLDLCEDIRKFKGWLESIDAGIERELVALSHDLTYKLPRFFHLHYQITQARNFADYLVDYSGSLLDDTKLIVRRIVTPLDRTVRHFEELLTEIISSVTEGVKEGNLDLVYKLCHVIAYEQREDVKASLFNSLGISASRDATLVDYSQYRSAPRYYLKFFYDRLELGLDELFKACVSSFERNPVEVYDNLEWLEGELAFVAQDLEPQFPSSWKIYNFFEKVYHERLHKFTMSIINSDPPADILMRILNYDNHYALVLAEIGDGSKRSIIGEELKNVVLQDYLKIIMSKMDEWNINLMAQEREAFLTREKPSQISFTSHVEDFDDNDHIVVYEHHLDIFVLPDCATPLKMLKEQADVAAELGYSKILVGVIEHWLLCHLARIESYLAIVDDEHSKYMLLYSNERLLLKQSKIRRVFHHKPKSEPEAELDVASMSPEQLAKISRPGLVEYLVTLCNTLEVNDQRLQGKMLDKYKLKVHANYFERLDTAFTSIVGPTNDLVSHVVDIICDIILNDMYPALAKVFTKEWYEDHEMDAGEGSIPAQLVEAIMDYMRDFINYSTSQVYMRIFYRFFGQFIAAYLRIGFENILHGSGKRIEPSSKPSRDFTRAAKRDAEYLYGGLQNSLNRKEAIWLLNYCRVIELLATLVTIDVSSVAEVWENEVLPCFHDCLVEYIRGILVCRKDVDQRQIELIINQLREIQKTYQELWDIPQPPLGEMASFSFTLK